MSATARSAGPPERRGGPHRTGGVRTGTHRTGTYRTGTVRGGAGRTATARGRSVGHRALPTSTGATAGTARTTAGSTSRSTAGGAPTRSQASRSAPVRPELRLVPSIPARDRAGRDRSRRLPFVLLVLALLVGTTLSLLVLNTAIAVESLKATSLRQQNDHREQELQRLQQQVVNGSTPQRLAGEAAKAGLVPAGTPGYLVVQPDGTSTFRGDPTPATAPPSPPPAPPGAQPGQPPAQHAGQQQSGQQQPGAQQAGGQQPGGQGGTTTGGN